MTLFYKDKNDSVHINEYEKIFSYSSLSLGTVLVCKRFCRNVYDVFTPMRNVSSYQLISEINNNKYLHVLDLIRTIDNLSLLDSISE